MTTELQAYADARATVAALRPDVGDAMRALLLAHSWAESRWGRLDGGIGLAGTNNWGSFQATTGWKLAHKLDRGYGVLAYTDTHPTATGGSIPYQAELRVYPSQREGAKGFLGGVEGMVGPLAAFDASNVRDYAARLKAHGYYEGFGKTNDERIDNYAKMLWGGLAHIKQLEAQRVAANVAGSADVGRGESFSKPERVHLFVGEVEQGGGDDSSGPLSSGSWPAVLPEPFCSVADDEDTKS